MTAVRLLSFLFVVCFAGVAQAQTFFNEPASACIPTAATIAAANSQTNVGSVQFAPGKIGQIVLNCPLARFDDETGDWRLSMTYQDSTGTATTASVRATFYKMGSSATTPIALGGINSNNSAAAGTNALFSGIFSQAIAFGGSAYWFRVILERTATNQTVILHSLRLEQITFSDIRLKHDVALLGHLDNGLGFYRFSYNGSDKAYVGVMAQEVEAIMPDAVVRGEDGYLRVSYGRLGLRMQTWEDWVASGEKIPATAPLPR